MQDTSSNNKRIAKNTIFLYSRAFFLMIITLYTMRVILSQLGVENYGIYNVVGGVVAMFAVISSALSSSISRFITFELGTGDIKKLKVIFSTSVNIQVALSLIVLLIGELVGVWFLNCRMSIPPDRLYAANWVLQCSLLTFCINLISVPYNSCIIAHEKMSVFAYISIIEAILKLLICYLLVFSPLDKLISYSLLMFSVALTIRFIYGFYCSRNFEESRYKWVYDKAVIREMTGFAGWNFVTNVAWIFNTQGVNMLVNIFFGVTLNAARGIATQVESAVTQFVYNFTTAVNPQITKYYAEGNNEQMFRLVTRSAKLSYLLMLIFALPLILEMDFVLNLWLTEVPDHAVMFSQLAILSALTGSLCRTYYMACMATGKIKKYVICVTSVGVLVFPLTWLAYSLGLSAEYSYYLFILIYIGVDYTCLVMSKQMLGFPIRAFYKDVLYPVSLTTIVSSIIPLFVTYNMESNWMRFFLQCILSITSVIIASYLFGFTRVERKKITMSIRNKISRK